jgi:transposase InsO family protein
VRDLAEARGWAIKTLCEIVDVERSAYYKWRNRKVTKREQLNQELCAIILEYFEESKHVLGFRTMTLRVNKFNQTGYNKKRIRRLMRLMGIASCIRRKRKGYVKSTPQVTAENVLNRRFEASQSNEKWLSDVTEFQIEGSRIFLCGIKDLCDKSVVSYRIAPRNDNRLVFSTFEAAVSMNPQAKPLFHSDRGFQYTHRMFRQKLDQIGATQSMSRVGRCIDNGPMEGFWGTLKCEMKHLFPYHTKQELIHSIDQYIRYYNEQRCQEKLKGLTPMEYRAQAS